MALNSYHFSIGNSTKGGIGLCARVTAPNKDAAVQILQDRLGENGDEITIRDGEEYIVIYLSPDNIEKKDIDEWEKEE